MATVMAVVKSHGIAGLWKGTQPSVLRVGLGAAVHFVVLEHMKGALLHLSACKDKSSSNEKPVLSPLGAAVSGGQSCQSLKANMIALPTAINTGQLTAPTITCNILL